MSHSLPLSERYALGKTILNQLTSPLTLADIDTSEDTEPLDSLINGYARTYCQGFEFYDRRFGTKGEELVYTVWAEVYTGETDYKDHEISYVTTISKQRIYILVTPSMSLDAIAKKATELIKDIEHNVTTSQYEHAGFDRLADYR